MEWFIDWWLPFPSGCVDLGGWHLWGHYKEPALWPPTSCQRVPASESPAVLPSAVLLCGWNTPELSAHRWTYIPKSCTFTLLIRLCPLLLFSSHLCYFSHLIWIIFSFSPYSHSDFRSDCQMSPGLCVHVHVFLSLLCFLPFSSTDLTVCCSLLPVEILCFRSLLL